MRNRLETYRPQVRFRDGMGVRFRAEPPCAAGKVPG